MCTPHCFKCPQKTNQVLSLTTENEWRLAWLSTLFLVSVLLLYPDRHLRLRRSIRKCIYCLRDTVPSSTWPRQKVQFVAFCDGRTSMLT